MEDIHVQIMESSPWKEAWVIVRQGSALANAVLLAGGS